MPVHKERAARWYGHAGASFPEVMHFWGSMADAGYGCDRRQKPVWRVDNTYGRELRTGNLELLLMGLDYLEFTGDWTFAREILIPMANETITFYVEHYSRDRQGQLRAVPMQAWRCPVLTRRVMLSGLLEISPA
eukprot:237680-Rhodomonas_salina.2